MLPRGVILVLVIVGLVGIGLAVIFAVRRGWFNTLRQK
ncbi:AEL051C-Ap [Eremothecium gossypii ATCC 10895]|uniref:AEL051C-Ap n=1 Tax=Eremothecium gossypii (strain ATCC 10895 / CBS 109.51 / FGSC 9923 / NRRL Y-1056) TaxID=284811 RepID=D8FGD1_EREGS|nr:AEL051C-Ap [Eremothecium gossypii ATCC 10895]ADJ41774.1 AEL051C-Ap [Eremothecium gossypii ATCC 10895]AEY96938.1 FAEL051C-Ap [Eremothecium gossypii FDAG1]